jgi:hypothetical protein
MSQSKQFESEHSILIVDDTEFLNGAQRSSPGVYRSLEGSGAFVFTDSPSIVSVKAQGK